MSYSLDNTISFLITKRKWALVIIWHLRVESKRFKDLKLELPSCSEKVLNETLKELQGLKLVSKKKFEIYPKFSEYRLTKLGYATIPIILEIIDFETFYSLNKEKF
ncbi:winged helix-turn-helix transcriptional regulator [Cetobacterium sp.]|uniref:winged helix-turn-helix transcriptional regulator n=1 Tax=Cetobacterium sp. TaxID=2071632 RepID=UPI003EE6B8FD